MRPQRYLLMLLVALLVLSVAPVAAGQDKPTLRGAGGAAGIGQYKGDHWGVVGATVANPTDEAVDLMVALSFDDAPRVQFATPVWLPPQSSRRVWFPVRPPRVERPDADADDDGKPKKATAFSIEGLLLDVDSDSDREAQLSRSSGLLVTARDNWLGGVLSDTEDDVAIQTAVAMRTGIELSRRLSYMTARDTPAIALGWQALDTLTLTAQNPELDAAQVAALRQWVISGGRLWVMLDQVDNDFMRRLLLDDWSIEPVDRVQLPRFTIESANPKRDPLTLEYEVPIEQVRVLAPGFEVLQTVNGWPAAMRRPIGNGWMLVTTLDPRGWRQVEDQPDANSALVELSNWFNRPPPVGASLDAAMQQHTVAQVGYKIADRITVMPIMVGYCVLLLAVGVVLHRRDRLERLPLLGGGLAIVAAGAMLVIGATSRQQVPATVAQTQWVQVAPDQGQAVVESIVALYSPDDQPANLAGSAGGVAWPTDAGDSGRNLRLVSSDLDRWEWRRLQAVAGGLRSVKFEHVTRLDQPVSAVGRFGPNGLDVTLRAGRFTSFNDVLIATPEGRLAANPKGDAAWTGGESLDGGRYLADAVLNDQQRQRQAFYASVLDRPGYPAEPTLLGWAEPADVGVSALDGAQSRGDALVAVPIRIEPAEPGQKVSVPAALIDSTSLRDKQRRSTLSLRNEMNGQWLELSHGGTSYRRFFVPRAVRPMRVESGKIILGFRAPGRVVTVFCFDGQTRRELKKLENPIGEVEIDIPQLQSAVGADGAFDVGITVSSSPGGDATAMWQVTRFEVNLSGTVLDRP